MKAKREYGRPTMKVVELRHTGMLMTSGFGASRNSYSHGRTDGSESTDEEVWE